MSDPKMAYTVKGCETKARELDEKFRQWAAKFKS